MAKKKKADAPLTVEAAQGIATEVARAYGNFQCDRCAREIVKRLGPSLDVALERLRTSDNSDVIGLAKEGIQISANRVHVGVRVGDKIFDNLHPEGVPSTEWAARFMTATDAPLIQESRPVREFFGKIFLVRKFNRWLFHS